MANQLINYFFLLFTSIWVSYAAETSTCVSVYKEGGAPAVFRSPRCPRWTLYDEDDGGWGWRNGPVTNCQLAMHQGRRPSQEDRTMCAFGIRIPFIGRNFLTEEVNVDIVAVFDGHNGAEASEMSSRLFLDYFYLHVYFLLNRAYSSVFKESSKHQGESEVVLHGVSLGVWPGSHTSSLDRKFMFEILRESLLRAIHDIDATFTKEASRKNLESGSTATVAVIVEGQLLVANVGDSKAVLCSETRYKDKCNDIRLISKRRRKKRFYSPSSEDTVNSGLMKHAPLHLCAKELTKDHHPDRDGERKRVEDAGGFVKDWGGVARVNGELAVSRAIGDVPYKRFGVISTPEVTDWLHLYANDTFLVVASDGIFEKLTVQEVCDLLREASLEGSNLNTKKHGLADLLVKAAIDRGSMDNMAAIVIPLAPYLFSSSRDENEYTANEYADSARVPAGKYTKSDNQEAHQSTSLISMDYLHQIETKFQKLMVKTDFRRAGCFYLTEDLKESSDFVFLSPNNGKSHEHNEVVPYFSEEQNSDASMWPSNLYSERGTCFDIDLGSDDAGGHCVNHETLINFFGLLKSIPFNDSGSHLSDSFIQTSTNFKYTLKRKFDRGSYGEVWLAFHWNCSSETLGTSVHPNVSNASSPLHSNKSMSGGDPNFSAKSDNDYFILKRIMVERGNAAYLSGLREKYFGEIFANASKFLEKLDLSGSGASLYTIHQSELESSIPGSKRVVYEEGLDHIARFIESFISKTKETWLVFRHEGTSLSKLLYTVAEKEVLHGDDSDRMSSNIQVLHPSVWWNWLRTTEAGKGEMRNIMRQLLLAIKSCHKRGITHRDIKPENMIVCFEDINSGHCERATPTGQNLHHLRMRIIDFGSALDKFTLKNLYGSGPSRLEQTYEYTPPEALLNATWFKAEARTTMKYDLWSAGVVFLELILGSPHVFQISDRTRAMLDQHLEGWGESMKDLAYKLRSLMEMCILIPGLPSQQHHERGKNQEGVSWPASWKCTEESFASLVKNRDPLKLGFPNIWALRLVRQLLAWHPEERISVDDALQHPYFESDL